MARKPWMKTATAFKWTRDGLMTTETAAEQRKADSHYPGLANLRGAASSCYGTKDAYQHYAGKPFHKLTADDLADLIYCDRWCRAYGKTVGEYFGAVPAAIAAE